MNLTRRWSRETIIFEIQSKFQAKEDLCYTVVAGTDVPLLRAAMRHFGSWRNAVEAAGISYDDIRRYKTWTKARIIERIQQLHKEEADLSWRHVSTQLDPQLAAAACKRKHFGSWRAALAASGLDYNLIRKYQDWTDEMITQRVLELHNEGVNLNARHIEETDITLITAARRHFQSWDGAVTAAGLDYKAIALRKPFRRARKTGPRPDEGQQNTVMLPLQMDLTQA